MILEVSEMGESLKTKANGKLRPSITLVLLTVHVAEEVSLCLLFYVRL